MHSRLSLKHNKLPKSKHCNLNRKNMITTKKPQEFQLGMNE